MTRVTNDLPPHIKVRMGTAPAYQDKIVIRNFDMDDIVAIEPEHVGAVIAALAAIQEARP